MTTSTDHYLDLTVEELLCLFDALGLATPPWLFGGNIPDDETQSHARKVGARSLRARGVVQFTEAGTPQVNTALASALLTAGRAHVATHIITAGKTIKSAFVFTTPEYTAAISVNDDLNQRVRLIEAPKTLGLLASLAELKVTTEPVAPKPDVSVNIGPIANVSAEELAGVAAANPTTSAEALIELGIDPVNAEAFATLFVPEAVVHSVTTSRHTGPETLTSARTAWIEYPDGSLRMVTAGADGEMLVADATPEAIMQSITEGFPS